MLNSKSIFNMAKGFLGESKASNIAKEFENISNIVNSLSNPVDALKQKGITAEQIAKFKNFTNNPMARKVIGQFFNPNEFYEKLNYIEQQFQNNPSPQMVQDDGLSKIQNLLKNAK